MHSDCSKKRTAFIAVVCLMLTVLVGCAGNAQGRNRKSDIVTLRLWDVPTKDSTDAFSRSTRAVFERFTQLHPNVRIVSGKGLSISGPAAESGLLMAIAGGTAPDVMYVNFRQMEQYINQGFLYPMDEYIKKDPDALKGIHPEITKVINFKGHYYCIPYFQCVMALYYRKDLFRAAGLDPNKPPQNWDQFYEYAKKLTVPEKGQWGCGFDANPQGTAWKWINYLWQAGGDVVKQDKNGKWKSSFNTPQGVVALDYYKKLLAGKWVRNGKTYEGVAHRSTELGNEISLGKVAMFTDYTFDVMTNNATGMNPNLIGIAALPAGPGGRRANEINAGMLGINSAVKDKRVRDAAWEYIRFMGSDEAKRIRTKVLVESGYAKMVNPVDLAKYGYKDYMSGIPKDWVSANQEAFKYGHPEPYGENCQMIYTELDQPLQEVQLNPGLNSKAVLDKAAFKINERLLGYRPPQEMKTKRRWAMITVIGLILAIAFFGTRQIKLLAEAHGVSQASQVTKGPSYHFVAWCFMLPALLAILIFSYYPLLRGMVMAFQDYKVMGGSRYIGLDNFIEAFSQESFWKGFYNTFIYVGLSLAMGFFVPIILAVMLNEVPRGKMLFRTLYYLPAVTSPLVQTLLWRQFYDPTPNGLFNQALQLLATGVNGFGSFLHFGALANWHIPTLKFLEDPKLAMICIILPGIWAGAGPGSIIYLAAMKSIPEELFEAADLDGASLFKKTFGMMIPMLKVLIVINLVGAFIGSFQAMDNIFVMTGGGPVYATHTLGLEVWYNAFMYLKYGYATAVAWIMGAMLIAFTMYQLKILQNVRFTTAGGR